MLASPLRYPGGKAKLFEYFIELIKANNLYNATYCEPYAGGAGLALKLLANGFVNTVFLNDIDVSIYAFWKSILDAPDEFCALIHNTPVTIEEWRRQQKIWSTADLSNTLSLGFATFFLNRTNRSGIIEGAGPIGGYKQESEWRIDVRFNKHQLINNILCIKQFRHKIQISNADAIAFIKNRFTDKDSFLYLDPPYYVKGSKLYRNFYEHSDHCQISELLEQNRQNKWVVSYDDVPEVRKIYHKFSPVTYSLGYSAGRKATGREIMYFSNAIVAPSVEGYEIAAA